MYNILLEYLKHQPLARERKNKDRAIVNLLINKYPELKEVKKEIIVELVKDYNSMDRYWRDITAQNVSLRGDDYEDKKVFEQKKQLELGYGNRIKVYG